MAFDDYGIIRAINGFPWAEPIPAMRPGDTSVGYTFEQKFGVQENNLQRPDLYDVEIKSMASNQSLVSLFTKNPTLPNRAVHYMLDCYGTSDGAIKRFNTNLAVGRNTAFGDRYLTLRCDDDGLWVVENSGADVSSNNIKCGWTIQAIQESAMKKLDKLLFTLAKKGDGTFTYFSPEHYSGFDFERFLRAIHCGLISIHFRIKGTIRAARNHGTAFRIRRQDLGVLYVSRTMELPIMSIHPHHCNRGAWL